MSGHTGRTKRIRRRRHSQLSPTPFTVSKLDDRSEFINVLKWLHNSSCGFNKGCISPAEFHVENQDKSESFSYRGICANKRIRNGEQILFLPEELLITSHHFNTGIQASLLSLHEKFVAF